MNPSGISPPEERRRRFETTAVPFMKSVYNMALRLTRVPEDASDLVQETYLRAYRTFDNYRPGTNCKAWLLTILYSIFVNRYRKKQREPVAISLEELEEKFRRSFRAEEADQPFAQVPTLPETWTDEEVRRAMEQLPESFRAVVLLIDVEGLSYEEAAAALNCPVGTVRSRLFRARRSLFVALQEHAKRTGYWKGPTEP